MDNKKRVYRMKLVVIKVKGLGLVSKAVYMEWEKVQKKNMFMFNCWVYCF